NSDPPVAGGEVRVNTTTANTQETFPETQRAVAMDAAGDYVVVWGSLSQGGEFRVNTTTASDQTSASVAMDSAGNFVVAWASNNQETVAGKKSGWGIY